MGCGPGTSLAGYESQAARENKILVGMERIGEILVTGFSLVFSDFNIREPSLWSLWLLASFALMLLYEVYWIRYFRSEKTLKDFYSSLAGIPVAGATLPAAAFLLLGIYGKTRLCSWPPSFWESAISVSI